MKILRLVIISFAVILFTMVASVSVFFVLTDPHTILNQVSEQLESKTGHALSADKVRLNPLKGIELKNVKLSRYGGFSHGTSLEFKNASFIYQPFALLLGHLDILSIQISDFYTTSDEIQALIKDFTKPSTKEKKRGKKSLFRITLRQLEILNSQILYQDIPLNIKTKIQPKKNINQTQIRLDINSLYGQFYFEGTPQEGKFQAQKIRLKKIFPKLPDILISKLYATVRKNEANVYEATGKTTVIQWENFLLRSSSQFKASYALKSKSLIIRNLDLHINKNHLMLERLYYHLPSRNISLQIPKSDIELSDFLPSLKGHLSGSLNLTYRKKLHLQGDLSVSNLQWGEITNANISLLALDPIFQGNLNLMTLSGAVSLNIYSSHLFSEPLSVSLQSQKLDLLPFINGIRENIPVKPDQSTQTNRKIDKGFSLPFPVLLSANIQNLILSKTHFENLRIQGKGKGELIQIPIFSFRWMRGNGNATLNLQEKILKGELTLKNAKLKDFTRDFLKDPRKFYGTLNLDGKFSVPLSNFSDTLIDLNLNILNGEMKELILQDELSKALYDIPLNDVFFKKFATRLTLSEANLRVQNLNFDSDSIKISGRAALDLPWLETKPIQWKKIATSSTFDLLSADFSINKDFLSGLPNFTQLLTAGFSDGNTLKIHITGKGALKKPSIQISQP